MNAYEFLRKAFGEEEVMHRNLYVQVEGAAERYQVVRINEYNAKLFDTNLEVRQIGSSTLLSVIRVSFLNNTLQRGRTLLTLRR